MAATLAMSDINASLRILYEDNSDDPQLRVHKLWAWLESEEDFWSHKKTLPVKTANPRGVATTLAVAQANTVAATSAQFDLTKVELFATPKVEMALIEGAMVSKADEFFKKITNIIDGAKETMLDVLGRGAYRSQFGVFSRVATGTASPITVTTGIDLYGVEIGDIITASPNADMTTPRAGTGTVTGVDIVSGQLTFTGTITLLAVGDYLAISGVTATAAGHLTWAPPTNSPTDVLFGAARTGKGRYLSGRFLDLTQEGAEGVWSRIHATMTTMADKPDAFFINPEDMANMHIAASEKKSISSNRYNFGWDAVTVYGMTVLEDPDCPRGYVMGVPKSFKIHSLGACPKVVDADGNTLLRLGNADSAEARIVSRYQHGNERPYAAITAIIPT